MSCFIRGYLTLDDGLFVFLVSSREGVRWG